MIFNCFIEAPTRKSFALFLFRLAQRVFTLLAKAALLVHMRGTSPADSSAIILACDFSVLGFSFSGSRFLLPTFQSKWPSGMSCFATRWPRAILATAILQTANKGTPNTYAEEGAWSGVMRSRVQ